MVDVTGRLVCAMTLSTIISYGISEVVQKAVDPSIPRISHMPIKLDKVLDDHVVGEVLKEVPLSCEESLQMCAGSVLQALGCILIGVKVGTMFFEEEGRNLWDAGKEYLQSQFSLALDDRYVALTSVICAMAGIALKYNANENIRNHLNNKQVKARIHNRKLHLFSTDGKRWLLG